MKDYIKEAEKNCVNIAKHMADMFKVIDALTVFGNRFFTARSGGTNGDFFKGLQLMQSALYARYTRALADCFTFVGVGGKDAEAYSKQQFVELFGDNTYAIMQFLDKSGNHPSWYTVADEKAFREQAAQKIVGMKGEQKTCQRSKD